MYTRTHLILSIGSLALLSACGSADNEPGPGGVSVGEARALDEAAEMIEAKRLPQQPLEDDPADELGESEAEAEE